MTMRDRFIERWEQMVAEHETLTKARKDAIDGAAEFVRNNLASALKIPKNNIVVGDLQDGRVTVIAVSKKPTLKAVLAFRSEDGKVVLVSVEGQTGEFAAEANDGIKGIAAGVESAFIKCMKDELNASGSSRR
jgi:hypothetical protein